MPEEPIAVKIRAARDGSYDHRPLVARIDKLLKEHNETLRAAALAAGLDHQAVRRIYNGFRPHMHVCILLADHFQINPNEFLELAGWPRLNAFDIRTASAEKLPIEAVEVALDIAKISEPGVRKQVAEAIRTLLSKYF